MRSSTTRTMGTRLHVLGPEHASFDDAAAAVIRRFAREDLRFSRFRGDSELTRVNEAAGARIRVSRGFAEVVAMALDGARASDGAFDPTVHDALLAAGYDRDLDEVLAGARGRLHPATPCGRWPEIELEGTDLRMPADVHLDLGAIAKGWAADRAAEDALGTGIPWIAVNAGGDLRIAGKAPALPVGVEDPDDPETSILTLELTSGALATSSTSRRSWGPGLHHVIDPATGAPVEGSIRQVTAWAPTCAEAELLATTALVTGDTHDLDANLVVVTGAEIVSTLPEVAA
jgi:thiamine biosynthesis lipoprotein